MYDFTRTDPGNHLLAAFPSHALDGFRGSLQSVELKAGTTLVPAGADLRHAYFPVTAVVSLFSPLLSGAGAEVAVVGKEGMVGLGTFMGADKATTDAVVQRTGKAWRISAHDIAALAREMEPVRNKLLRYSETLFTHMAQSLVCHSHHPVQAQLCCWLLQHLDRQAGDELHVTQERIAGMLGSRRESVTESALKLQRDGVIRYQRGRIQVLDRRQLEHQCCECYGVMRRAFDQLRSLHKPAPRAKPVYAFPAVPHRFQSLGAAHAEPMDLQH